MTITRRSFLSASAGLAAMPVLRATAATLPREADIVVIGAGAAGRALGGGPAGVLPRGPLPLHPEPVPGGREVGAVQGAGGQLKTPSSVRYEATKFKDSLWPRVEHRNRTRSRTWRRFGLSNTLSGLLVPQIW